MPSLRRSGRPVVLCRPAPRLPLRPAWTPYLALRMNVSFLSSRFCPPVANPDFLSRTAQ
jgi:hypothetical protein